MYSIEGYSGRRLLPSHFPQYDSPKGKGKTCTVEFQRKHAALMVSWFYGFTAAP